MPQSKSESEQFKALDTTSAALRASVPVSSRSSSRIEPQPELSLTFHPPPRSGSGQVQLQPVNQPGREDPDGSLLAPDCLPFPLNSPT